MPFDPSPSIVGRELLGPQLGRTVMQGFPDFDPVAYLDRACAKAKSAEDSVLNDSSALPEDQQASELSDSWDVPVVLEAISPHILDEAAEEDAGTVAHVVLSRVHLHNIGKLWAVAGDN